MNNDEQTNPMPDVEVLNRLKAWFDEQSLPESLQIDKATFAPELEKTVHSLFDQAYLNQANPRMQGSVRLLLRIKDKLEHPDPSR